MSELLICDHCGELSIYEKTIFIQDKPICPICHAQALNHLKLNSCEVMKKKYYLQEGKLTR